MEFYVVQKGLIRNDAFYSSFLFSYHLSHFTYFEIVQADTLSLIPRKFGCHMFVGQDHGLALAAHSLHMGCPGHPGLLVFWALLRHSQAKMVSTFINVNVSSCAISGMVGFGTVCWLDRTLVWPWLPIVFTWVILATLASFFFGRWLDMENDAKRGQEGFCQLCEDLVEDIRQWRDGSHR